MDVTVNDLNMMAATLALNPEADPAKYGWDREPYLTHWKTMQSQVAQMVKDGIAVDTAFDLER